MGIALMAVPGCAERACLRTCSVHYFPKADIGIDGSLDEPVWQEVPVVREFSFPWENRPAPATEFRSFRDDRTLYFSFRVHDADVVIEAFNGESTLDREDRVELFFARDDALRHYYCVEVDPCGHVHDYAASFYRRFDSSWNCPGIRTAASRTKQGYVVEGSIPLETLESLGVLSRDADSSVRAGIFRADFRHGHGAAPEEHWISWIDPGTKEPDFHVPSALGCFRIGKPTTSVGAQ